MTPERECSSNAEEYQECWVRPLRHIVPPAEEHLTEAAVAARLNRTQTRALFLTRKHRLVLVRGPPGTGKTQLAAAAVRAWTQTVPSDSTIIAAGPSNAATNNLLDRIARDKDDHVKLGRLGDDPSVFEPSRAKFSLPHKASWGGEFGDVKRHVLNGRVRKLISEGQHHALFAAYIKSAELGSCSTYFLLADEAGQATENTSAILLCNSMPGGHVLMVGDEHQLPPTVRDRNADWDGLSTSLLERPNRTHEGTDHLIMLETQYRMHTDIQRFPNLQYYGGLLRSGLKSEPAKIAGIPRPAIRNDAPKEGKEISNEGERICR